MTCAEGWSRGVWCAAWRPPAAACMLLRTWVRVRELVLERWWSIRYGTDIALVLVPLILVLIALIPVVIALILVSMSPASARAATAVAKCKSSAEVVKVHQ